MRWWRGKTGCKTSKFKMDYRCTIGIAEMRKMHNKQQKKEVVTRNPPRSSALKEAKVMQAQKAHHALHRM